MSAPGRSVRAAGKIGLDERGSVAAELTIAVPCLILILLFVAVLTTRGVTARLRLDDAAQQAARAASLARTPATATLAAHSIAEQELAQAGPGCPAPAVQVDTSQFRPGGVVTVTITCQVDLAQAAPLGVPATRSLTATAVSPIDTWRGESLGLSNPEVLPSP